MEIKEMLPKVMVLMGVSRLLFYYTASSVIIVVMIIKHRKNKKNYQREYCALVNL
ncbi:MAG: hypothetical protein ACREV6_07415 [Clostridium sp.]|uniref:hypothetical protein n=1 Tax=Clostridium sp. TaxID=1506 RepID=UPI003D6D07E6